VRDWPEKELDTGGKFQGGYREGGVGQWVTWLPWSAKAAWKEPSRCPLKTFQKLIMPESDELIIMAAWGR
jgi:hypothetical protein